MANVQTEHGYLKLANRLAEAVVVAPFTGTQLKIVTCVIRLTYGWGQKTARVSHGSIAERINVRNTGGFRRAFLELLAQGVLIEVEAPTGRAAGIYAINKDFEKWGKFSVAESTLVSMYGKRPPSGPKDITKPSDLAESYIYYARAAKRLKIGYSRDPWSRVANMRTSRPEIELIAVEPGGRELERERHAQFAEWRLDDKREWFRWSPAIADFIRSFSSPTGARNKDDKAQSNDESRAPTEDDRHVPDESRVPPVGTSYAPTGTPFMPPQGGGNGSKSLIGENVAPRKDIEIQERQTAAVATARELPAAEAKDGEVITDYALGLTAALNRAITAKWGEQPNVVGYASALDTAEDLLRTGVELEFAQRIISEKVPKLKTKPFSVKYLHEAIKEAKGQADQRAYDASAVLPSTGKRGGAPTGIGSLLTPSDQQKQKSEDALVREYEQARRVATAAWGSDPANETRYAAIVITVNNEYALLKNSTYGKRAIEVVVIERCAEACAFPSFNEWRQSHSNSSGECERKGALEVTHVNTVMTPWIYSSQCRIVCADLCKPIDHADQRPSRSRPRWRSTDRTDHDRDAWATRGRQPESVEAASTSGAGGWSPRGHAGRERVHMDRLHGGRRVGDVREALPRIGRADGDCEVAAGAAGTVRADEARHGARDRAADGAKRVSARYARNRASISSASSDLARAAVTR
jgi:phage replication O-like protein O